MSSTHAIHEDEAAFVRAFIVRERCERWLTLLAHPKGRRKILDRLNHHHRRELDLRHAREGPSGYQGILTTLVELGAGSMAHVMADSSDFDGRDLPLREALEAFVMHPFAVVVSCVPGRLAVFHEEWARSFTLLRR